MCIAIVKTKDGTITDNQLKNCFESNPDGAGIAYSHKGTLWIVKGIFTEKEFIEQYHKAEELADGAMLIHCRISTSGKVDRTNCHPHVVHNNCVMIHNGVLKIDVPKNSDVSDTVIYVRDYLKPLPKDFMFDTGIINLITRDIGAGNKFAFLNANGSYAIANEDAGHWKNGVWFSNYSYTDYSYYYKNSKNWKKTKYGYTETSKCYGGYDDDLYEYDDEYFKLTKGEQEKMELVIENLTPEQFIKLGQNPVYDFWTSSLRRLKENEVLTEGEKQLSELDTYLSEYYEDCYYSAIDGILLEYGADYETAKANNELSDYEDFILKQYTLGTSSEEEKKFDEDNKKYTIKLDDVEIDDEDIIDENDVIIYDESGNVINDDEDDYYSDDTYNRYDVDETDKDLVKTINALQQ